MLSAVLPAGGVPSGSHVDQDDLLEGGELYSLLSVGGLTGGPGGSAGFLRTGPFTVISMPMDTGSLFEEDEGGKVCVFWLPVPGVVW